jgi:hypothetical protein
MLCLSLSAEMSVILDERARGRTVFQTLAATGAFLCVDLVEMPRF